MDGSGTNRLNVWQRVLDESRRWVSRVAPYKGEHLQPVARDFFAGGFFSGGPTAQSGARRQGVRLLDAVCGDALLPAWSGPFLAGDLLRAGERGRQAQPPRRGRRPQTLHALLRHRPPPRRALQRGVLSDAGALPRRCRAIRSNRNPSQIGKLFQSATSFAFSIVR